MMEVVVVLTLILTLMGIGICDSGEITTGVIVQDGQQVGNYTDVRTGDNVDRYISTARGVGKPPERITKDVFEYSQEWSTPVDTEPASPWGNEDSYKYDSPWGGE